MIDVWIKNARRKITTGSKITSHDHSNPFRNYRHQQNFLRTINRGVIQFATSPLYHSKNNLYGIIKGTVSWKKNDFNSELSEIGSHDGSKWIEAPSNSQTLFRPG
eukprot:Pompholyxophrys_sp_v1_NODE_211_length_1152_cov_1.803099.p2 type:complete len:105 gc:universal NODE_211_length_1152_cov_1.803099:1081-767(-)